jgi:hypothetical protein
LVRKEGILMAQIDMDAQRKFRIRSFIDTAVYDEYPDGVDENDLDAILLGFEKFLDECEQERVRQ